MTSIDPQTGQLTPLGLYTFEGILPEGIAFDADSDTLAVGIFNFEDIRKPGAIEFWDVVPPSQEFPVPRLRKNDYRIPVARGIHYIRARQQILLPRSSRLLFGLDKIAKIFQLKIKLLSCKPGKDFMSRANVIDEPQTIFLNGVTAFISCHNNGVIKSEGHMAECVFAYLRQGKAVISHAGQRFEFEAGEAVFVNKNVFCELEKTASEMKDGLYESIWFSLCDEFLHDFVRLKNLAGVVPSDAPKIVKIAASNELSGFIESVHPYFGTTLAAEESLVRGKIMELLFLLAHYYPDLVKSLVKTSTDYEFRSTLENNYVQSLCLERFAKMTNRSLSSFKRDFQRVFQTSPARWLKKKRLDLAHRLLSQTDKSVTEVCYETGFVNLSHFSRAFKELFGYSPQSLKNGIETERRFIADPKI